MLHAILRGKLDELTPEPQRLEDALTSTVFGTLVWLDQWDLLARWLLGAAHCCPVDGHSADNHAIWFWPRLAGAVEPDVVLRLGSTLLVVEAKYRSGRHDRAAREDDQADQVRDQLLRQNRCVTTPIEGRIRYAEPIEAAISACRLVQIVVANARRRRALEEYRESAAHLPGLRFATWQELFRLLTAPALSDLRWTADLKAYLEHTALAPFEALGRRLAPALDAQVIRRWCAVRSASGFRKAVVEAALTGRVRKWRGRGMPSQFRLMCERSITPLSSVWRITRVRGGPATSMRAIHMPHTHRALVGWRATGSSSKGRK
jgi:hypothetical protein